MPYAPFWGRCNSCKQKAAGASLPDATFCGQLSRVYDVLPVRRPFLLIVEWFFKLVKNIGQPFGSAI
jgi:hypothetical protein